MSRCLCLGAALGVAALCLAACEEKLDPFVEGGQQQLPDTVSYNDHIRPLLEGHCTGCHASHRQGADRNGAPVGIDLDTYSDAVAWAERSNARIQAGSMPPSGGVSDYERALFQRWVDQGTPE
jgi:uncharacterized membrane protein